MVQKLEDELAAYEESNNLTVSLSDITNTPPPQNQSPTHKPRNSGSLGSITKSLLSSMTKMMSYLRQSEVQLKGEVSVRIQMLQTMTEQQNLMDSLTAVSMTPLINDWCALYGVCDLLKLLMYNVHMH